MEVRGVPPDDVLERSTRKKLFFDGNTPKVVPNSRGKKRHPGTRTLVEKVKTNEDSFLDFLDKCFEWDPEKRLTPVEAFSHEFIVEGLRSHTKNPKTPVTSKGDGS
jgi:dual specificity tyrosine-phosphorylation-regulated kinase 2/3/4